MTTDNASRTEYVTPETRCPQCGTVHPMLERLANEAEEHLLRANQEQGKRIAAESSLAAANAEIEKLRTAAQSALPYIGWNEKRCDLQDAIDAAKAKEAI